jgi:D-alanine-D-alanine ligase
MRVAVLAGGRSSEHEVSLQSAASVRDGLRAAGHEPLWVQLERDGTWWHEGEEVALRAGRGLLGAAAAFPALHGPFGEDGTVQGLLELLDVPYVGSGVMASAVCMDKVLFKDLMAQAGLPQVRYWLAGDGDTDRVREEARMPCWVKPSRLGSSVGIARVDRAEDLEAAIAQAAAHDPRVIVEESASGLEVECSVLGHTADPDASEPGEIVLLKGAGWYDYEAKYDEGGMELVVPARVSPAARDRVRDLARTAFRLAGCSGLARADFFVDGDAVLLNELNTLPGNTPTSVYGKLWEAGGLPYPQLLDRLVRIALERHAAERAHSF